MIEDRKIGVRGLVGADIFVVVTVLVQSLKPTQLDLQCPKWHHLQEIQLVRFNQSCLPGYGEI
jgi:hypothetical protein